MTKGEQVGPYVHELWRTEEAKTNRKPPVCKPCWELNYCPYGVLVEQFPLGQENDPTRCMIFGHVCPVYHVGSPFTETRMLRTTRRDITRPQQFAVLKRDGGVCQICFCNVKPDQIHFDHIIPWSRGGPTTVANLRVLCAECNLRRGADIVDELLVGNIGFHWSRPEGIMRLEYFLTVLGAGQEFYARESRYPSGNELAKIFKVKPTHVEEQAGRDLLAVARVYHNPPAHLVSSIHAALSWRWGFKDFRVHKLADAAKRHAMRSSLLLAAEIELIEMIGYRIELSPGDRKLWLRR